jgi:hypothetical protein
LFNHLFLIMGSEVFNTIEHYFTSSTVPDPPQSFPK